jgi:transcriptional regulator with XRE-family HTH domain
MTYLSLADSRLFLYNPNMNLNGHKGRFPSPAVELPPSSQSGIVGDGGATDELIDAGQPEGLNQVELAQRIKKLRLERGMTIDDAAVQSGLTRSWWSKVENFRITPSLPALFRLASTLGTTISKLLEGLDARPPLVVVRPSERLKIRRDPEISDIDYESLAHPRPNRRMDPLVLTIEPGGGRKKALAHDGEEFMLILAGRVLLEYGNERVELVVADSAYFDAAVEHRLSNPFDSQAKVLCVHDSSRSTTDTDEQT